MVRRERRDPAAPPPPRALGPFLEFASLPDRALGLVRDALEADDVFRQRVWEMVDPDTLDRGARLFLERPDGWAEGIAALVDEQIRHDEARELEASRESARQEVRILSAERDELRTTLDGLGSEVARLRERASTHDELISSLENELAEARAGFEEANEARTEAIRQLKTQESLSVRRLETQKRLESELAAANERLEHSTSVESGPGGAGDPEADPGDPPIVAAAMSFSARARALVDELSDQLTALDEVLGANLSDADHSDPVDVDIGADADADADVGVAAGAGRDRSAPRRAVRLGRGLSADSPEGLAAMLDLPDVLVMVDGYNVTMKGWAHLGISQQRESLIRSVTTLQRRHGGSWHLVFDGSEAGQRPAVSAPMGVRVHFTPANLEADDRLLEFVEQAHIEVPIVVVSSDNRVRDGARSRGANVVSSESLLALMHISH